MKLFYKPLDIMLDFDEHNLIELVIEDRDYFAKTLFDLYEAFDALEGEWICSSDNKTVSLDKNVYAINDYYFMLNPSKSRTVQSALLKEIISCATDAEHLEVGQELAAKIEQYGLSIIQDLNFGFEVSTDEGFDITALIKALGIKIFLNTDDLVARTIEFCDVLQTLTGINLFVLANIQTLMGAGNLRALTKELKYHGHKTLLLSSTQASCDIPRRIIVNEDLAVLS